MVDDGCSDPVSTSLTVDVHPEIQTSFLLGPEVCFEDTTFATVAAFPPANYVYEWNTNPPVSGNTISGNPTLFSVNITNEDTGCSTSSSIELPGFDPLNAHFTVSPNEPCVTLNEAEIELLDFSVGAIQGSWDFGDGTPPITYQSGQTVMHTYTDTGTFTISLQIENEGSCISQAKATICIEPEHTLFAPNAFTPNRDGKNDDFILLGTGISEIEWHVYNRFGEKLFTGNSLDSYWDGYYKGERVQPGIYTFVATYTPITTNKEKVLKGFVTVIY
jgi:gliding motility-associated-like protein